MKKLLVMLAALGSLLAFGATPNPNAQKFLDQLQSAFNSHDASKFGKLFAQDATVITPDGKTLSGRDALQKDMSGRMSGMLKDAHTTFTVLGTRPITDKALWVDAEHTLTNVTRPDGKKGTQLLHLTLLLEKQGNDWVATEARPYALQPRQAMGTGGSGK